jgi:cell division control protein 6
LQSYAERSIFKDENKLSIEYVPQYLPHREKELSLLDLFFKSILEHPGGMSQRVFICGGIGVGKTVISKVFGSRIEMRGQRKGINLRYVHVNCRVNKSLFTILRRVVDMLNIPFPSRGYSDEELLHSLIKYFDDQNLFLILSLDELESLIREEGSEPLYSLTRFQEERINMPQRISMICILRDPQILKTVDESTMSTLQHNIIDLDKYTHSQLRDILEYRVSEAFRENTVRPDTIQLISDITGDRGDARYAIEILWRAGKFAEAEGVSEVLPEHVRKASASVYSSIRKETLNFLRLHEILLLLGICRKLGQAESAYITMGDAEEAYKVVCEEYDKKPHGHTKIWEYVQELEDVGIIITKISGPGLRGKTTLIGVPEVPASILEKEIMRILEMKE